MTDLKKMSEEENKLRELAEMVKDNDYTPDGLREYSTFEDHEIAYLSSVNPQTILSLLDTITQLRRQNEIMKKALEFYTDGKIYQTEYITLACGCCGDSIEPEIFDDNGRCAREALKDCEELK